MKIDWALITNIASPIIALIVGVILDRFLERKSRLISYLSHVSAFTLRDQNRSNIFTHSIVVGNAGRKAAQNVRIGHFLLPEHYQINPAITHEVRPVPDTGPEIFIPLLVPGEQITIQYLYFPPVTWDKVNSYTKSDDGFAKIINVLPTPLPAKWVIRLYNSLAFIGLVTFIYLVVLTIRFLITLIVH